MNSFFASIGGGRSFKWEGKYGGLGAKPPEDDDTFVKICYFVMVLRMTVIYLHSLFTSVFVVALWNRADHYIFML